MIPNANIPKTFIPDAWDSYKYNFKPISPSNKRKYNIIVVGSGLAGSSAAAALGEQGYNVKVFTFHDSPRRAHSIAAQGGINAAKNYQNDGDSVFRLFYDTIKGGDFRSREANVYRLAQVSENIIDHCVAQGVPFARDYGGFLDNRSFGGSLVARTFYARGQTGQQLLLGAYSALSRQIARGQVSIHSRSEMLDLVIIDGQAKGIIVRNLITGEISSFMADAIVLASGGYGAIFYLSTNAINCNVTASFRAYKRGALFANPSFTQIHPTCIPVSGDHQSKLTLMSESLRNDGRVWVPIKPGDTRDAKDIPKSERDYYLERKYPSYGNLAPRDIASRAAKQVCDEGRGVGHLGFGVYLDFADAISRLGSNIIEERYGNLFAMYQKITDEDPYKTPMRIYPASHYTMGGLWVDYELMSNIPGLFVIGEANFSDHGANRLGASALMQGLADGYFILPYTICHYLNSIKVDTKIADHKEVKDTINNVKDRINNLFNIKGKTSATMFHKKLGKIMWDHCGMSRSKESINHALAIIPSLIDEFYHDLALPNHSDFNQDLEKALRVEDFLAMSLLLCHDALHRKESCGAHFREEYQTKDGEAARNDDEYCYVAAFKYEGEKNPPSLIKEPLAFDLVPLQARSYK